MIKVLTMKLLSTLLLFVFCIQVTTACSETIPINSKDRRQEVHDCKPLHIAVEEGKINVVKKIIKTKTQKDQLTCIKYAIRQTAPIGGENQFQAFRYLAEQLIRMKLPDQQTILNDLLQNYAIVYLSADLDYTEYLLSVGALPKKPNKSGWFPVTSALWAVNDYGDCKTSRLLINASSPEVLALQNKVGETALVQSVDRAGSCPDELKLLVQKTAGLNLVDQDGNTALHHVLMKMKRDINPVSQKQPYKVDLELLRILLKRGASTKIPNKKSITSSQLLRELKRKGCKC